MKKLLTATAILLATPFATYAGADFVEGDRTFAADAELGATVTTGNTESTSVKGRLDMKHELGDWENQYLLETLYKKDDGEETGKRYYGLVQGNYIFSDDDYIFINANYERDPFTGFDSTSIASAGYGHKFVDDGKTLFTMEVGPGYRYKRLDDESALEAGYDSESGWIGHGVMNFEAKISDSSKFKQMFVADVGENFEGRSETSITANIVGALAMKFAVIVRYNSEPLDDTESTDTETNMTLLYSF